MNNPINRNLEDAPLGEPKPARPTGRDLVERGLEALDVSNYERVGINNVPKKDQISDVDWLKVMDLGKALAAMQDGMPAHVRGKWGIGCRIAAHAEMWRMDPFGIADQTYMVNNRLGYMSQLIHALINRNAPLKHRLTCEYIGEGGERQCVVRGLLVSRFGVEDMREYTTPMVKDIKVKNSPLWQNDPDQQLWYFGVRAWGRKWVPEVIYGLYTREELEADRSLGYEDTAPGLQARLVASGRGENGHREGHAAAELAQMAGGTGVAGAAPASPVAEAMPVAPKGAKRASEPPVADARVEPSDTAEPVKPPTTVAAYKKYAKAWMADCKDAAALVARWRDERSLRNEVGMTGDDRAPLEDMLKDRRKELEASNG